MKNEIKFEKEKDNIIIEFTNKKNLENDNIEISEELKLKENVDDKANNKENKNDIKLKKKKKKKKKKNDKLEEESEEDKIIKEIMGFNKFDSTKNKSHRDTDVSGAFLGRKAKRIYQRFMNYKPFSKILKQTYMSLNQEF